MPKERQQQRHGTYSAFTTAVDQNKILPEEICIIDSGHPDTTDGKALYYKTATGDPVRVANADEVALLDGAVTTAKIADEAVTTGKIGDSAINTAKINNNAVTTAKIADGAVTTPKINNGAVTTAKIEDDAVTPAKLDRLYMEYKQTAENALDTAIDPTVIYRYKVTATGKRYRVFCVTCSENATSGTRTQYRYDDNGTFDKRTQTKTGGTWGAWGAWEEFGGGSSTTIINTTTVPDSAQWTSIPTTYAGETGEVGEIALWEGHGLWYLKVVGGTTTTTYTWKQLGEQEDIDDLEANKMDMNGTALSDAGIEDLPMGQVFVSSDTNIAIGIKTVAEGEEGDRRAYTTDYIDSQFTSVANHYASRSYVDNNFVPNSALPDTSALYFIERGGAYRYPVRTLTYFDFREAMLNSQGFAIIAGSSPQYLYPLSIDFIKSLNSDASFEIKAHFVDYNGQRIDLVGTGTKNETVALNAPAT